MKGARQGDRRVLRTRDYRPGSSPDGLPRKGTRCAAQIERTSLESSGVSDMDAAFQCLPYPLTKLHKFGIGFDIFVARACERNIDNFVDARWSRSDGEAPGGK